MNIQWLDIKPDSQAVLPEHESIYFPAVFMTWMELFQHSESLPRKSAFDPAHFTRSLPYSWIYEYLPEEDDFLCRLSGSEVDEAWGRSLSDHTLGQLSSDPRAEICRQRMKMVVACPAIMHARIFLEPDLQPAEKLALPLADDNGEIRYVIGISHYQYLPNRFDIDTGQQPDFLRYYRFTQSCS